MTCSKKRKLMFVLLVLLVSTVLFAGSAEPAHAGLWSWLTDKVSVAGQVVATQFVKGIVILLAAVFTGLAYILEAVVKSIDIVIRNSPTAFLVTITSGWEVVRGFANMFFIVILIVMAFATIFDIGSFGFPGYDVGSLISRFLVAALLINFSLVIATLLINASDTVSGVFLAGLGNFSDHMINSVGIATLYQIALNPGVDGGQLAQIMASLTFGIFLTIILIGCTLIALVVAVVRIPYLALLMIFSPLAWLTSILPATRGVNKKWWEHFIRWTTFMPIFLLVLYFGIQFLTKQEQFVAAASGAVLKGSLGSFGFTANFLFYYFTAALIFAGGTAMAISGGIFAGAGGIAAASKTRDFLTSNAARFTGATALRGAVGERVAQLQKEGLPGRARFLYGGQAALERQQAAYAQRLGVRGAADRLLAAGRDRIKTIENDPTKLKALADNRRGTAEERIAALSRMRELGAATNEDIQLEYRLLGSVDRTGVKGREMAEKLDYSKMSMAERKEWAKLGDIAVQKKVALAQIEKGELKSVEELKAAASLYKNAGEQRGFLEQAKKKNLVAAVSAMGELDLLAGKEPSVEIAESVKKMGKAQILELNPDDLVKDGQITDAGKALGAALKGKLRDSVLNEASEAQREAFDTIAKSNRGGNLGALQAKLDAAKQRAFGAANKQQLDAANAEIAGIEAEMEAARKG